MSAIGCMGTRACSHRWIEFRLTPTSPPRSRCVSFKAMRRFLSGTASRLRSKDSHVSLLCGRLIKIAAEVGKGYPVAPALRFGLRIRPEDPRGQLGRYVVTAFAYGGNLGPTEVARHGFTAPLRRDGGAGLSPPLEPTAFYGANGTPARAIFHCPLTSQLHGGVRYPSVNAERRLWQRSGWSC